MIRIGQRLGLASEGVLRLGKNTVEKYVVWCERSEKLKAATQDLGVNEEFVRYHEQQLTATAVKDHLIKGGVCEATKKLDIEVQEPTIIEDWPGGRTGQPQGGRSLDSCKVIPSHLGLCGALGKYKSPNHVSQSHAHHQDEGQQLARLILGAKGKGSHNNADLRTSTVVVLATRLSGALLRVLTTHAKTSGLPASKRLMQVQ